MPCGSYLLRFLCAVVCVGPRKCLHLRFRELASNCTHWHIHIVCPRILGERLELLLHIKLVLLGEGRRTDAISARTMARSARRNAAFWIASVNESLHGIAIAVTAMGARSAFTSVFRQSCCRGHWGGCGSCPRGRSSVRWQAVRSRGRRALGE